MTHDYKRNGATDLFAAMNVGTGEILYDTRSSHKGTDVLAFFELIDLHVAKELITHAQWDVLITDLHLQGGNGNELVRWAQEVRPHLPAILTTTFPEIDFQVDAKVALVHNHESQAERSPSLFDEYLRATALYWGRFSDGKSAEPFDVVRDRVSMPTSNADDVSRATT